MPFKRFKGVLERPFRVFEENQVIHIKFAKMANRTLSRYLPFKASESYNRFSQPF